jgi:hypothetical protein
MARIAERFLAELFSEITENGLPPRPRREKLRKEVFGKAKARAQEIFPSTDSSPRQSSSSVSFELLSDLTPLGVTR